jgi:hypothetical protein
VKSDGVVGSEDGGVDAVPKGGMQKTACVDMSRWTGVGIERERASVRTSLPVSHPSWGKTGEAALRCRTYLQRFFAQFGP